MLRNGYKIARVVDLCEVERSGRRSYKADGKRITKKLFEALVWYAVDADTMITTVVGNRISRCKTVYIPEFNNGGVLSDLDKETVKWN